MVLSNLAKRLVRSSLTAVTVALLASLLPSRPATAASNCYSNDDEAHVIALCTRAIESGTLHGPALALAYANRAAEYFREGDTVRAIADETASIKIHPTQDAYDVRGRAFDAQGDSRRAIDDWTKAIKLPGFDVLIYKSRADAFYRIGAFAKALADESHLIGEETRGAPAFEYYDRALDEDALGSYQQALDDLTKAIALKDDNMRGFAIVYRTHNPNGPSYVEDKNFAVAYAARGLVYLHKGDCEKALADENKAVEADGTLVVAYVYRGAAKYECNDFAAAVSDESLALSVDSSSAAAYNARGLAEFALGKYALAVADFDSALAINPKDGYTRYSRLDAANREAVAGPSSAPPSDPALASRTFLVFFGSGRSTITDDDTKALANSVVDYAKEFTASLPALVMVSGYRDGAEGIGQATISNQRALEVATYLVNGGVPASLVRYRDGGTGNPSNPYVDSDKFGKDPKTKDAADPLARCARIEITRVYPSLPPPPYSS